MIWGFAGPWYGQFLRQPDGTLPAGEEAQLWAKLEFLRRHGLRCLGLGLTAFDALAPDLRERLGAYLAEHDLHLTLYVGFKYLEADDAEAQRQADQTAALLARHAATARCPLCLTTPRAGHRFDRQRPLLEKFDRLTASLTPLAAAVHAAGLPLGIENHGDYYVDELVGLCRRVPHLGLFLDTGNCFLIGERPAPACAVAAPYVVGTHFKDHLVAPRHDARPLHFEVGGAALGDGDVGLRECWNLLRERNPRWPELVMEIEMVAPEGGDPVAALDRSLAFLRSLPGGGLE
ncbi:MAG: TIM barrel protein [Fimbriimonadaceae bacterium]|nr:TIM barrel protein [Fimbriimonadaceae bacterium]